LINDILDLKFLLAPFSKISKEQSLENWRLDRKVLLRCMKILILYLQNDVAHASWHSEYVRIREKVATSNINDVNNEINSESAFGFVIRIDQTTPITNVTKFHGV
ncbi:hypothetical protein PMAYCL1PPCAC_25617, partial [Pristionchus mayeri]